MAKKYTNDTPLHEHDCPKCHFLGVYEGMDLYCCDGFYRTLIARFGVDGDYYSCPISIIEKGVNSHEKATIEAYRRSMQVPLPLRLKLRYLMDKIGIRRARYDNKKERLHMLLCHLANILDMTIFFITLSTYSSNFHAKVVFWDYFDED